MVILQAPPRELNLPTLHQKPPMPAELLQRTMTRTRATVTCPSNSDKLRRSRTADLAAIRRNSSSSSLNIVEECITEYMRKADEQPAAVQSI